MGKEFIGLWLGNLDGGNVIKNAYLFIFFVTGFGIEKEKIRKIVLFLPTSWILVVLIQIK